MKARRCGFGVPLDQLEPGDREAVEQFRRFLEGELAFAPDRKTYVEADDPRAVHFAGRPGGEHVNAEANTAHVRVDWRTLGVTRPEGEA